MKMQFNFLHLDVSESLQNYTISSLDNIARFLLKEGDSHCFFSKTRNEFHVEITVNTAEKFFKATGSSHDIYDAVDKTIEKLEKQFLKVKTVYKNHKHFDISKEGKLKTINSQFEVKPARRKSVTKKSS